MAWPVPVSENVTSVGSGHGTTTIADWEAATDNDLVTATQSETAELDDETYNESPYLYGATTSTSYFRTIRAKSGEGHDGTVNASGAKITHSTFRVRDKHFVLEGVILDGGGSIEHYFAPADSMLMVRNCILDNFVGHCIAPTSPGAGSEQWVQNCIFHGFGANRAMSSLTSAENCSVYGTGAYNVVTVTTCTNVISIGASTQDFFNSGGTNNISEDTTAPGADPPTVHEVAWDDVWNSITDDSEDLLLKSDSTSASAAGDDRSGETYGFTDDIRGNTRSDWDIGADEFQSGGGGGKPTLYFISQSLGQGA